MRGLKFHRADTTPCRGWSHRSRGAWIEICKYNVWKYDRRCRIAHAVRGLKWIEPAQDPFQNMSHRSRGAWIEIVRVSVSGINSVGRIAHAVRGLKFTSGLSASRIYPGRVAHAVY